MLAVKMHCWTRVSGGLGMNFENVLVLCFKFISVGDACLALKCSGFFLFFFFL